MNKIRKYKGNNRFKMVHPVGPGALPWASRGQRAEPGRSQLGRSQPRPAGPPPASQTGRGLGQVCWPAQIILVNNAELNLR